MLAHKTVDAGLLERELHLEELQALVRCGHRSLLRLNRSQEMNLSSGCTHCDFAHLIAADLALGPAALRLSLERGCALCLTLQLVTEERAFVLPLLGPAVLLPRLSLDFALPSAWRVAQTYLLRLVLAH